MTSLTLSDVTVVIVTFEASAFLERSLAALPHSRLGGVVVVDNASSDRSAAVARATGHRGLRVVALEQNIGFGGGCNVGLAEATTALVLFLNPDAVIETASLEALAAYLDAHPTVGMVAPRLFRDGQAITSAGRHSTLRSSLRYVAPRSVLSRFPDCALPASHDRSGRVDYVEGACMLLRRDELLSIGGFDERYFLFFEEQDVARRLGAAGFETHLCAEARAEHVIGASRTTLAFDARPYYFESNRAYLSRWHGRGVAAIYAIVVQVAWWVRARAGRVDRGQAQAMIEAVRLRAGVGRDRRESARREAE